MDNANAWQTVVIQWINSIELNNNSNLLLTTLLKDYIMKAKNVFCFVYLFVWYAQVECALLYFVFMVFSFDWIFRINNYMEKWFIIKVNWIRIRLFVRHVLLCNILHIIQHTSLSFYGFHGKNSISKNHSAILWHI